MDERTAKPMDKFTAKLTELRAHALSAAQKVLADLACWDHTTVTEGTDRAIALSVNKDGRCYSKSYRYSEVEVACIAFDIGALALHLDVRSEATERAIVSFGWRSEWGGEDPRPEVGKPGETVKLLTLADVPTKQPEFGQWLQAMRQAAGITRQELANTADVKYTTVHNAESGRSFTIEETRKDIVRALEKLGGDDLRNMQVAPLDPKRRGNPKLSLVTAPPARES